MIPSFCRQTITRVRALYKQERGSSVPNWNDSYSEEIYPVSVQPSSSNISLDGRVLGVSDSLTVYCNPDVDIKAGDHILFEGQEYTVVEAPRKWISATGLVNSTQVIMTLWKG